jgi:hypothetical protein
MMVTSKILFCSLGVLPARERRKVVVADYPVVKCVSDPWKYSDFRLVTVAPYLSTPERARGSLVKFSVRGISVLDGGLMVELPTRHSIEPDDPVLHLSSKNKFPLRSVVALDLENTSDEEVTPQVLVVAELYGSAAGDCWSACDRWLGWVPGARRALDLAGETAARVSEEMLELRESLALSVGVWRSLEEDARRTSTGRSAVEASAGFGPVVVDGCSTDHPEEDLVDVVVVRFARPFAPRVLKIAPQNATAFEIVDLRVRKRIAGECSHVRGFDVRVLGREGRVEDLFGRSMMLSSSPLPGRYFADGGGPIYCDRVGTDEELCMFVRNRDAVATELSGLVVGDAAGSRSED